ncbi:tRNA guanosine-2'-O-methyltransferase [Macroventuria anomochaeta]|uniref:tRNA guanosine-2'-O-methyltransferase n=1 Tax=Macroventuria anomochaeta TaxID=301207 RepID=A0ACB6SFT7_9PLEO|nr:tRNA guanosine-2'-O-methyltransferase [Macroventuria anomochaeta]KAF2632198.1 tRNA guanosine-2'-O-methyltransferase [Macroventuria anomochaeta]
MPEYLVRLAQIHETFRKAELHALAELAGVELEIVKYDDDSPYCIVHLPSDAAAKQVASRAMLIQGIYELWGQGSTYDEFRSNVTETSSTKWPTYQTSTFSFRIERYRGVQAPAEQTRAIIESFQFLGFKGKVQIKNPEASFRIFEEYDLDAKEPKYLYLGRWIADSGRDAKNTYDLKKRHYISTTSMDAELALLTANIAQAAPGKIFYDPFMGTGGFPLACAHYGAVVTGSDIDGRSIRGLGGSARRGQTGKKNVEMNFQQYGLEGNYLGGFVSDLTNTPLRLPSSHGVTTETDFAYLDGIVCDPPYGIREGLKVLGSRETLLPTERATHAAQYRTEGYIPPKRPYSFTALLDDILTFAVSTLVPNGRLSMWMPTANDEDVELIIPQHPCLELTSVCVQAFNKWSRRLLTYRRKRASEIPEGALEEMAKRAYETGTRASDLNDFRRKYFQGFREFEDMKKEFIRMKVGAGVKQEEARAEADQIQEAKVSAAEKAELAKKEVEARTKDAEAAAVKAEELNERFNAEART